MSDHIIAKRNDEFLWQHTETQVLMLRNGRMRRKDFLLHFLLGVF